jgi:hypothetical protein
MHNIKTLFNLTGGSAVPAGSAGGARMPGQPEMEKVMPIARSPSTTPVPKRKHHRARTARGLPTIEPEFLSIADAATYTSESPWTVKMRLRSGVYEGVKAGRRTLVRFSSVKRHIATLPAAEFAAPPPRIRRSSAAAPAP